MSGMLLQRRHTLLSTTRSRKLAAAVPGVVSFFVLAEVGFHPRFELHSPIFRFWISYSHLRVLSIVTV